MGPTHPPASQGAAPAPRSVRASVRARTRERILRGAAAAVARHGVSKLDMRDVCELSGVSRGTLYRYFGSREDLLREVAVAESVRFWERCVAAVREVPDGVSRVRLLLESATREAHAHPALRRLLETEPALVLVGARQHFPLVRDQLRALLMPLLEQAPSVRHGVVEADELLDGLTRLLFSLFLLPTQGADEAARSLRILDPLLRRPARHRGAASLRAAGARGAR